MPIPIHCTLFSIFGLVPAVFHGLSLMVYMANIEFGREARIADKECMYN